MMYRIAGLLGEDLGELDHLCIILKTFRQIDHLVGRILRSHNVRWVKVPSEKDKPVDRKDRRQPTMC